MKLNTKKAAQLNFRVNSELKEEVEDILDELGLTLSEAIRIFLKKVKAVKGIPFDLKLKPEERIPSASTKRALNLIEEGKVEEYETVDDFMKMVDDL